MSYLSTVELLILVESADVLSLICRGKFFVSLRSIFAANCSHHLETVAWIYGMKVILFESSFQIVFRQVIDQCLDLGMLDVLGLQCMGLHHSFQLSSKVV